MAIKGLINFESIWRRSLKAMGLYHKWLFYKERTSPTPKMVAMRNLYSQFVKPGYVCFDIGANMGSRVATFLTLKAKVIAVEPQEECVKELEKVFKGYDVTIVQKGVGAKNEVRDFYVASNSLVSSFSTEWIEGMKQKLKKDRWDKVVQMEIVTLDSLIEKYGEPDFVKIDTEGFEYEVLKGLSRPVKSLSFEYTLPEPDNKAIACVKKLNELYGNKVKYNIARDESYTMKFKEWQSAEGLLALIQSEEFKTENFGNYGDIYVLPA